ncbi:hypothetical protein K1719_001061 [Acacia pycnantha]|nr:hypothetical protein K1719_001061 [Acacia pycnantha]
MMMRLRTVKEESFGILKMAIVISVMFGAEAADKNDVFSPCSDAKVERGDGFSFGVAFSNKDSFFLNQGPQLSPCDSRLNLSGMGAQLAVFRPQVDQISFLTINGSSFDPVKSGGFMVAFAGHQYAAISSPIMFSDNSHTITSFTLIMEFKEGTLENLIWKSFGCEGCSGQSVCLNNQDCAVAVSECQNNGGGGCNIGIQLAFTGTDKNLNVLNSWYQVRNLRPYSLPSLFSDLPDSIIATS